eukprot:4426710-Amphidinium_carterae.1
MSGCWRNCSCCLLCQHELATAMQDHLSFGFMVFAVLEVQKFFKQGSKAIECCQSIHIHAYA